MYQGKFSILGIGEFTLDKLGRNFDYLKSIKLIISISVAFYDVLKGDSVIVCTKD